MIAYNKKSLDDRFIRNEAHKAWRRKQLGDNYWHWISEAYPEPFHSVNFFTRVGLFLLTLLIWSVIQLLLFVFIEGALKETVIGAACIVSGVLAIVALEWVIRTRKAYRNGIDDALLYASGSLIFAGFALCWGLGTMQGCWLIFILAAAGSLRYADRLLTLTAYGALIALVVNGLMASGLGNLLAFVLIALSALVYFASKQLAAFESCRHYRENLQWLRVASLLTGYFAGNYYVVREANGWISGQPGPVALAALWWTLTFLVPVLYILRGIQKKDIVFLWTGLVLVAAAVFTFRYYYHVLSPEAAMLIGGSILTAGSVLLIRHLRQPRRGFTSEAPEYPSILENLPAEAMILTETFRSTGGLPGDNGFKFGGGTTGGGGAGGTF